jgi:acyl-CoA reductase-like NAD-dependent aldehyde dehydrogenase
MAQEQKFLIGREWRSSPDTEPNRNPYTAKVIADICQAQDQDVDDAITCAGEAFGEMKRMPAYRRAEILLGIASRIKKDRKEIALTITEESAKPISQALAETDRAILTFTAAAEEAKRLNGETIPLDIASHSERRWSLTRKFPIGPVSGFSPFNFPLNLIAHKLAPCLAAGNTLILKPPPQAPSTALRLGQIVLNAGAPPGAFNVVPCRVETAARLVTDERVRMLNFTGSSAAGWELKRMAGKKKVLLELGGNAGVLVDRTANLDFAVPRIAFGAYAYAGQVCIKVQRIFVHEDIYDEFLLRFKEAVGELHVGDPFDDDTAVSALIEPEAADRVEAWIAEAKEGGATVLYGGNRKGSIIEPTLLSNTAVTMKVYAEEVFGPVATIHRYRDLQEAVDGVNDTAYGLQAGIFSNDFRTIFYAYDRFDVGSLIVNDIPTYRIDTMPYGGMKNSGEGREGVRYAIDAMTELKQMVFNFI